MAEQRFEYDVFLSHASADKAAVRELAQRLKGDGLRVWLDEWVLQPGDSIPRLREQGLESSPSLVAGLARPPSTPNGSPSNDTPHSSATPPTSKDDSTHYDSNSVKTRTRFGDSIPQIGSFGV